jgi:AcrR family transcriptional regulator
MPKPSAKERVLDAYQDILIEHGIGAITLEAVAARAEVSKGGLLYHFGSKEALLQGLIDRVGHLGVADLETARTAPEGVVRYYLRSSVTDVTQDAAMHRTTLAAMRLIGNEDAVDEAIRAYTRNWRTLLTEHVGDPVLADFVGTTGDGLYLRAMLGEDTSHLIDDFIELLERLGV